MAHSASTTQPFLTLTPTGPARAVRAVGAVASPSADADRFHRARIRKARGVRPAGWLIIQGGGVPGPECRRDAAAGRARARRRRRKSREEP